MKKGVPPPPEEYAEVKPIVKNKFKKGHVASTDSNQGIKKAIKEAGIPHTRVIHKKKNFCHVVRMPLKCLNKRTHESTNKTPMQ